MKKVVIFGSTSGMAEAYARLMAIQGAHLILVGRDPQRLELQRKDLEIRGSPKVDTFTMEFLSVESQAEVLSWCFQDQPVDVVLIAHGTLVPQDESERDAEKLRRNFDVNFLSPVFLMNAMIPHLEKQRKGVLAVITSVAGDRGRASNYHYGAAKAGLQAFLSGLRGRLFPFGVHVLDLRPGFISTAMTAHLKQGPLFVSPERAAQTIHRAIERKSYVAYVPGFWFFIMLVIRSIPTFVFQRLKI